MRLERRSFLQALGASGLWVTAFGCASGIGGDASAPAPDGSDIDKRDGIFSSGHAERTVRRLIDVFLPSRPGSPGALDTGAYELLGARSYLLVAIHLGYLPPLPDAIMNDLDRLAQLVTRAVVADLDLAAGLRGLGKTFNDLSPDEQAGVVADRWDGIAGPIYGFVRATAMISFLGAPTSDAGLPVLGLPPYLDFADGLHNTGYPDYSENRVPSIDGLTVWNQLPSGDLP
jgi:hypothetical protein